MLVPAASINEKGGVWTRPRVLRGAQASNSFDVAQGHPKLIALTLAAFAHVHVMAKDED